MTKYFVVVTAVLFVVVTQTYVWGKGKYRWMKYDKFDIIDEQYRTVNQDNCRAKSKDQLTMRADVVSQLPVYNRLLSQVWYKNRSALIHLHNMALNRAFFYSYIIQKMNDTRTFNSQPNWMYYYLSAVADVNANPNTLNGSALIFDADCHYPNWYTTVAFNRTLNLFGPKAYRWDDFRDQDNRLREPTRQVVQIVDYGAGPSMNYTHPKFKMNPWYSSWLPDVKGDEDSMTKFTYYIGIKESNGTGRFSKDTYESFAFFGPNSPGASEKELRRLPVQWTAPYFDCGGSNKWVISAVSPVVDFMPRYSNFTHMRRQRIVAVSVMSIDFIGVDFNACGVSAGNPGPSYLSGIHRCKPGTLCKHVAGQGFKRGGYSCFCKPGQRAPWYVEQPYLGSDIEVATEEEYRTDFSCTPVNHRQVLPVVDNQRRVTVEGGWILAGRQDHISQERKKRSESKSSLNLSSRNRIVDNYGISKHEVSTAKEHAGKEKCKEPTELKVEDWELPEVMRLVERLRELRQSNRLATSFQFPERFASYNMSGLFGNRETRNLVDIDVETMYQKDVQKHRSIKSSIKENTNLTSASEFLQEDILRIRNRHMDRYLASQTRSSPARRKRALVFDDQAFDKMMRIFRKRASVTADNCHALPNHQLKLPGDVSYGVWNQFESEGRTALRLSHFLSMYLQTVMPNENFGNLRGGGRIHVDHLYGEVLANVMANFKIYASGVFFDRSKFENMDGSVREFFGPWAFRRSGSIYVMDTAGLRSRYVNEDWFVRAKERFATNFYKIRTYKMRAHVRSDPNGTSSFRHEYFPVAYKASNYEAGFWTSPYFRCDGNVDAWVMTYVSPFFGVTSRRTKLEFRGVTTVDVPLNLLEINQCAQRYTVPNAFKNTARCDYFSTTCVPQPGFPFMRGSYRCLCKLGFEYWHADGKFWFEGSLIELEYEKKRAGIFSRFDQLTCRTSGAAVIETCLKCVIPYVLFILCKTFLLKNL